MTYFLPKNRKASHDYHLGDTFEAGISLHGWEVKALLSGQGNLNEAYVRVIGDEVFLVGCHITPTGQFSKFSDLDPTRSRKLLLKRQEINKMIGRCQEAGFTIIPLEFTYPRKLIKLKISLAKGKKLFDKRETLKRKDAEREIQRAMKHHSK